jgi:hypothetical protein
MVLRFKKVEDSDSLFGPFNSLAELKAATDMPNHARAYVESDGEFVFRKSSSMAVNEPLIVVPNSGGGRWFRVSVADEKNMVKRVLSGGSTSTVINDNSSSTTNVYSAAKIDQLLASITNGGGTGEGGTGTGTGGAVVGTYAEILALIKAGNLINGATYIINDFQSKEQIHGAPVGTFYTAPVEKLALLATSNSTFYDYAVSLTHTNEIVKYNIAVDKQRLNETYVSYNWENDAEYPDNYHSEGVIGIGYDYLQLAGAEFMPVAGSPFMYDVEWDDWNELDYFTIPAQFNSSEWIRFDYVNNRIYFVKYAETGFPSNLSGIYCRSYVYTYGYDMKGQTSHRIDKVLDSEYSHDYRAQKFRRYKFNIPNGVDGTVYPIGTFVYNTSYGTVLQVTDSNPFTQSEINSTWLRLNYLCNYVLHLDQTQFLGQPVTVDVNDFYDSFVYGTNDSIGRGVKIFTDGSTIPNACCTAFMENSKFVIKYGAKGTIFYLINSDVILEDSWDNNYSYMNGYNTAIQGINTSKIYLRGSLIASQMDNIASTTERNVPIINSIIANRGIYNSRISDISYSTVHRIHSSTLFGDIYWNNSVDYDSVFTTKTGALPSINDYTVSTTSVYSSSKVNSLINSNCVPLNLSEYTTVNGSSYPLSYSSGTVNTTVGSHSFEYLGTVVQDSKGLRESASVQSGNKRWQQGSTQNIIHNTNGEISSYSRRFYLSSQESGTTFGGGAYIEMSLSNLSQWILLRADDKATNTYGSLGVSPLGVVFSTNNGSYDLGYINDTVSSIRTVYSSSKIDSLIAGLSGGSGSGSGSGSGASTFLALTDTPNTYANYQNQLVRVKWDNSSLEFFTPSFVNSYHWESQHIQQGSNTDFSVGTGATGTTSIFRMRGTGNIQLSTTPASNKEVGYSIQPGVMSAHMYAQDYSDSANYWASYAGALVRQESTGGVFEVQVSQRGDKVTYPNSSDRATAIFHIRPDGLYWNNQKILLTFA